MTANGAPRIPRDPSRRRQLWPCSAVGALLTVGALFGLVYKVPAPTVCATYAVLGRVARR
ncbi:hypothetical protein [Streptomyces sp. NBC_00878]|uniref:hypothetical protein n=1 Tax=Streptomyces sp. NBC_00878 TaxID=2975854 RepID=UPI00224FFCEB|nr:hypothetical protein [Streptomyces sp. NBC_00878]MCX4906318.1 hypothetical protein [Streptomyces sp. NBC_00878]